MEVTEAPNIQGNFVSEKINKIRWRPDAFNNSHFFATGSWDNDVNKIKLWDFQENQEDQDIYPFLVNEYPFSGDVTELQFIDLDYFVASSSSGSVYLLEIESKKTEVLLKKRTEWTNLHRFPNGESSSCTSFAVYSKDVTTVGEDGSVNFLNAEHKSTIRTIKNADSCSIVCVTFLKHNEILTSNFRGQMKIWDLRNKDNYPSSTFMLSGDQVSPSCVQFHPTQRHIVIIGDEEGSLTIWDLRQNTYPVNILNAHESSVNEIQFHPDHPDQLFTCSSAGDIWHWSPKAIPIESSVWLSSSETLSNKFEVYTLMPQLHKPINTLDINRNKLICGCDNEAVYLINNLQLYH